MKKIILLFIFIIGCKNTVTKKETKLFFDDSPVFYAHGDCVLFLKPSEKLFNEKLKFIDGINEISSDFNYYANKFYKKQNKEYKTYFVEDPLVALITTKSDTIYIDRDKRNLNYAVVLLNKDSLQVLKGINTDKDIETALGILNTEKIKVNRFPEKIKIKIHSEEGQEKDITIVRNEIEEYLDFDFNYPKLIKKVDSSKVLYFNKKFKVFIEKEKFNQKKKSFNIEKFHGVDGGLPSELIKDIQIVIDNRFIDVGKENYNDLAEPNFVSSNVHELNDESLIIEMHNSDGAGGYALYFFINKYGEIERYIIYP